MNWMCLQQILWSNNIPAWAGKSINFIEDFSITESGEFACLFLPDTASNFDIKDKGVGTGEFKSSSIVTLNVLVTDSFIGKVENTISFLTLGVSVWGWLLNKFSGPAVYIMRKNTLLVVRNAVIKKQTFWAVFNSSNSLPADVKQIALFIIPELAIGFRTFKEWSLISILLSRDLQSG